MIYVEKYGRARQATDDNIIGSMRIACWITKVTDKHSGCIIRIAFAQQQWLGERASMLLIHTSSVLLGLRFPHR